MGCGCRVGIVLGCIRIQTGTQMAGDMQASWLAWVHPKSCTAVVGLFDSECLLASVGLQTHSLLHLRRSFCVAFGNY
jgi:hypothetical protein